LSWWIFLDFLYLWPVALIAIGLEMIVKNTRFHNLAYLSSVLLLGCFIWVVWADGGLSNGYSSSDGYSSNEAKLEYHSEQAVMVKATFENGRIYVNSGDSDLLRVTSGGSRNRVGMTSNCDAERCEVDLRNQERRFFKRVNYSSSDNYWKCYVNPAVTSSYNLKLDETDLRLFADDLKVNSINIDAIQSDLLIKLGTDVPRIDITLSGRSTDVDLVLPDSVGLRLEGIELRPATIEMFELVDRGGVFTNKFADISPVQVSIVSSIDNGRFSLSTYERVKSVVDTF
ncbi:MAG: hypothetical protein WBP29_10495, partial [Candidatus Zixiibacteriota bacterium]